MVKKKSLVWQNCSEEELPGLLKTWLATQSIQGSILFLEGEMGAGKSTFVREVLKILAPKVQSQGSPTFPLVQTYYTDDRTPFYHIDLYRLKNEDELEESGIESQIDEPDAIVCVEWASLFPNAFAHWFDEESYRLKKVFLVRIESAAEGKRSYRIDAF